MGRRKEPITGNGPIAELALALTDLRESSDLTLRELAKRVGYSHSTLSSAERGRMAPSWAVTDAFVNGCGASSAEWKPLWMAAMAEQARDVMLPPASDGRTLAQLPSGTPGFVGRVHELGQLCALVKSISQDSYSPPLICTIEGMAGVGKTALALQFAHLKARQFSDGQLFVNAQGYRPDRRPLTPREVLIHLLRGLGHKFLASSMNVEELASIYRSLTAGMNILIVLDDARTADQVRVAVPGQGPCFVLTTSRNSLNGLIVRDGANQVHLGCLSGDDSLEVLAKVMTQRSVDSDPRAAAQLAELCGHLPLALRLAAHHVTTRRYQTVRELVDALAADHRCLDVLAVSDDETASIRSVLSWSYGGLSPDVAATLSLVGRSLGSDFSLYQVIDLVRGDPAYVRSMLRTLVDMNMLQDLGGDRFAVHRLVRLYASEQARAESSAQCSPS